VLIQWSSRIEETAMTVTARPSSNSTSLANGFPSEPPALAAGSSCEPLALATVSPRLPTGPTAGDSDSSDPDPSINLYEVSVVMPCLNEVRTLAGCIRQARAALDSGNLHGEIIIADNGSTDGSVELAESEGAKVVHVARRGYGSALQGGFAAARGEYIFMADADGSYDFGEIPRFVAKLREGYDLVMGNRFAGEIKPGAMPWHHRYIGNPFLSFVGTVMFRPSCSDLHCGLRALSRDLSRSPGFRSSGMEFASEIVGRCAFDDLKITELPITLSCDKRGRRSHLRSMRDGLRHLSLIVSLRLEHSSKHLTSQGVVFWCIAFAMASLAAIVGLDYKKPNRHFSTEVFALSNSRENVIELNMGESVCGETLRRSIQIQNNSISEMREPFAYSGCKCLRFSLKPQVIAPGEHGTIEVEFNVPGFIGPFSTIRAGIVNDRMQSVAIAAYGHAGSPVLASKDLGDTVALQPIELSRSLELTDKLNWEIDYAKSDIPEWLEITKTAKGAVSQLEFVANDNARLYVGETRVVLGVKHTGGEKPDFAWGFKVSIPAIISSSHSRIILTSNRPALEITLKPKVFFDFASMDIILDSDNVSYTVLKRDASQMKVRLAANDFQELSLAQLKLISNGRLIGAVPILVSGEGG